MENVRGITMNIHVHKTEIFTKWLKGLKDQRARAVILNRIDRFALGNFGTCSPVGNGVSEAKIDHGPGYRLYFIRRGQILVVLLCGGDKSTQQKDVRKAHRLAEEIKQ